MNDPRGSVWRKWDLHVHTPESIVHDYAGQDPWPQFIDELEKLPPDFKVIGINDYIFLDGYKRILAEKAKGRLANIDMFLPVIELRLDKFGGSQGHISRVNYHIIFSDALTPEIIEYQFLNALPSKYLLSPQYEHFRTNGKWQALPTKQSLNDLGSLIIESVPEKERSKFGPPLIEGFNNLCLSLTSITEVLKGHYFTDKFVTAVGKTEWADIKWNDQSIAEKKTIINGADLVFVSSETIEHWTKAKTFLQDAKVNSRLLDCSDAHSFSGSPCKDRLGQCMTWVKADTTFEGLLQVLTEHDERVFVGDTPPQLSRVRANPTKYIDSIYLRRKADATLSETWFDNNLPLNPGLVAIIGNKGKGKSALTDTIGLLCDTKQHNDFTFLSSANFRQVRDNKARHFEATLIWVSGDPITKGLDADVDEEEPELVKYIPQNFLEKICTQLGKIEESAFDHELKKVIFSHVDPMYRLGKTSLDELIEYKTSEANEKKGILKQELHRINEEIVNLEDRGYPAYRQRIDNALKVKHLELEAHEKAKPTEVPKPENDPIRQKQIAEAAEAIEIAKASALELESEIPGVTRDEARCVQLIATADRLIERLANMERQIRTFFAESSEDMTNLGISPDEILKVTVTRQPLTDRRRSLLEEKAKLDEQLKPSAVSGLAQKKRELEDRIKQLQDD